MRGMLRTVATSGRDEEGHMSGTSDRGPAYRRWLAGRTVSVVGLARSGIAAARLIRRVGGGVLASDSGAAASLSAEAWQLERDGCRLWTGGDPAEAFESADMVVVSPGVPLWPPAVSAAGARGAPAIGQLGPGWLVREAGLASRVAGRVLGFSRLEPLQHGVFVRGGWIVAKLNGHVEPICPVAEIALRGQHNVENVLAATACALWTGMAPLAIRRGIAGFRGVEHRIERVRDDRGVVFYNDSKGTNVASTIKALESFTEPVILIAGGKGKGQDFAPLAAAARGRLKQAVLIGADRGQIRAVLEAVGVPCADAGSMHEAVAVARSL